MYILPLPFKILTFCGVWLPIEWNEEKKLKYLYKNYSFAVIFSTYFLVSSQALLLAVSEYDLDFYMEILFTFITSISCCGKAMNFLLRRDKIIDLAKIVTTDLCAPIDDVELQIQKKTEDFIRLFTIYFNGLAQFSLVCFLLVPIVQDEEVRSLPFNMWLPYDIHQSSNYWITYTFEIGPMVAAVLINVTTDVVVSGFLLQACNQIDMLKHRLHKLPEILKYSINQDQSSQDILQKYELKCMTNAVRHHIEILR